MTCLNSDNARLRHVLAAGLLSCGAIAMTCEFARAADIPDDFFLRGAISSQPVHWEGFVVGGQIGHTSMNADFSSATSQVVHQLLQATEVEETAQPSGWAVLGSSDRTGANWGGFVGYNWQVDDLILGVDGAYNRMSGLNASDGPTTLARSVGLPSGNTDAVSITARSSLKMIDYATLRARAGYPFGQFLPYAFVGAAVGRFDYRTSSTVTVVETDKNGNQVTVPFGTAVLSKSGALAAGFVTGLGVDVAVLPNVFLRAEWEFAGFSELQGIRPTMNTGRVGLALHF